MNEGNSTGRTEQPVYAGVCMPTPENNPSLHSGEKDEKWGRCVKAPDQMWMGCLLAQEARRRQREV